MQKGKEKEEEKEEEVQLSTGKPVNSAKKLAVTYAFNFVRAKITKEHYKKRLKLFFDDVGLPGSDLDEQGQHFLEQAKQDSEWAELMIMNYLVKQRERVEAGQITAGTLKTLWEPIKAFTRRHRELKNSIDWDSIKDAMPRPKHYSNDRIPTIQELRKLIKFPDRRIEAIVYTMCSSGIRIGAWEYLKWRHITPVQNDKTGEVVAAKIIVYAGTPEQYFSFITPEAYNSLKDWMDYRASYGEQITPESWIMRNNFRTAYVKRPEGGGNNGRGNKPRKMAVPTINRMLVRALYEQGLRETLEEGTRRHEYKTAHSYRKYFKTRAEQSMNRLNVEYLLGHTVGLNSNYYRPTEQELITDYLKAVPVLTINGSNETLEKSLEQQEQESEKMKKRIEELTEEQKKLNEMVSTSMQTLASTLRMFTSVDETTGNVPTVKVRKWRKDTINMIKTFTEEDNDIELQQQLERLEQLVEQQQQQPVQQQPE
jgi:hypothetical protein